MSDYDDTNKGVMFPPYPDAKMVLSGKLNIEGNELRVVGIRQKLSREGEPVIVVYEQTAILYPNDQKGNEKAPKYSGPLSKHADLRVAAWAGKKDDTHYLQLKVSEKQNMDSEPASNGQSSGGDFDKMNDEIPF